MKLKDHQLLDGLAVAAREQALVMVHAENNDMIAWLAHRLLQQGHTAPKFHAVAHDPLAESEATNRAIALSRLLGVPLLIVHVSGHEAIATIRNAKARGAAVYAESCRSEEHTSELPSLMRISYAVFCLKKKKTYQPS